MIAHNKLFLIHKLNIYFGYINEKGIYIPEIIFSCSKQNEMKLLIEDLKTNPIHVILQKTKRNDNNIKDVGKYKNTDIIIVILKGKYIIEQKKEIKKEVENCL